MDTQSIIPDTPLITSEDVIEEQDQQQKEDQHLENQIAEVLLTPGWKLLEDKLNGYIDSFRSGRFMGDTATMDLADIGQKFVIANTVAGICEDLKSTVHNAAGAVRDERRGN